LTAATMTIKRQETKNVLMTVLHIEKKSMMIKKMTTTKNVTMLIATTYQRVAFQMKVMKKNEAL